MDLVGTMYKYNNYIRIYSYTYIYIYMMAYLIIVIVPYYNQ